MQWHTRQAALALGRSCLDRRKVRARARQPKAAFSRPTTTALLEGELSAFLCIDEFASMLSRRVFERTRGAGRAAHQPTSALQAHHLQNGTALASRVQLLVHTGTSACPPSSCRLCSDLDARFLPTLPMRSYPYPPLTARGGSPANPPAANGVGMTDAGASPSASPAPSTPSIEQDPLLSYVQSQASVRTWELARLA